MVIRPITREEIKRLKRKRRNKIRLMSAGVLGFIICVAIVALYANDYIEIGDRAKGEEITTGVNPNFDSFDKPEYNASQSDADNTTDNTDDDSSEEQASTDVPSDTSDDSDGSDDDDGMGRTDTEFVVPDTELPPVEQIIGDNWASEEAYTKNSNLAVDLTYFDDVVFIGDSRTEGLVYYTGLNLNGFCYKGLNVGKLDTSADITVPGYGGKYTCYQAIAMTNYKYYYCSFGINELGWQSIDNFCEMFSKLIDKIKEENPEAIVYVESILPVTEKESADDDVFSQDRVNEFNEKLKEMCMNRGDVIYLDVAAAVTDDNGYLPEEASVDGIHCTSAYYKRIIQYIRCNTYSPK
ncbi:MAG: GDSL-type esterase/lipase family protein [Wujia sp.]